MKLKEYEDLENLKKLKNFEECTFKPQIDKKYLFSNAGLNNWRETVATTFS